MMQMPGISNNNSTFLYQENDQLYSVCSMRIIVDQWVLKDQRADKNIMSQIVHNHINSLNVIYEKNVRVKDDRQLRSHIDVLGPPPKKNILFQQPISPQNDVFRGISFFGGNLYRNTHRK